jgi:hypothetical protein
MPGGIALSLRYNDNAGIVTVVWDGKAEEFDLYAPRGVTVDRVFSGWEAGHRSVQAWAWLVGTYILYFIAFASILLGLAYWLDDRWAGNRRASIVLGVLYAVIFIVFLLGKLAYPRFSAERVFRDTTSYVTTSQAPLTSRDLWAGERPFTIPLVYKAFGVSAANITEPQMLNQIAHFQFWLSVIAWTVLGLGAAWGLRNQWLKPLAFGLILAFSLSLEISLWDSLLLSESISLSLFALLLGCWLLWDALPAKGSSLVLSVAYLLGVMLITVLYSFTRESNPYFALVGGGLFGLAVISRRVKPHLRRYFAAYAAFVIGMFVLQTLSFSSGNRWVIHIYDQLGMRLLEDNRAYQYFVSAGLPVTPDLMKITTMPSTEYQVYLQSAPEMQAVRDWVARRGNTTYLGYLLSDPLDAALEPLGKLPVLLNGTNLEYHYPRYAAPTIPSWLEVFSGKAYPRQPAILLAFFALGLFFTAAYFFGARPGRTSWLVLAVLILTLYPLLFIVWHGNPMELERHATQLGIQLRLAGWMAIILGLDALVISD